MRIQVSVRGRVQGVGFRQFTAARAKQLGVVGWVRNESDGSVSVVAEGEEDALRQLIEDLKRGPSLSRVRDVETVRDAPAGEFTSFQIRY